MQGPTYEGQAGVGRLPAIPCGGRSAQGMEPRWQPKTGRLALQVAVDSGSSGRSRNSREQAPAYYTSVRPSANRRETVEALHWDQGVPTVTGCKAGNSLTGTKHRGGARAGR